MVIGSDESAALAESLQALLALQDEDLRTDQLRHRRAHLSERMELEEIEHELARMSKDSISAGTERDELNARLSTLEAETSEIDQRVAAIESRLRAGSAASFRDQGSMALEIESLGRRKHVLEDEELEVMEALEPLEQYFGELDLRRVALGERTVALRSELALGEAELDRSLAGLQARRAELLQAVPASLAAEYERLRQHLGGIGAARLVHNVCSGCNLSLSASEIDRIRHGPLTLLHCEQCGRILVPEL